VTQINDDIDRLRHSATRALLERRDVVVVASVSCIYGLGLPAKFIDAALRLRVGQVPTTGSQQGEEEGEGDPGRSNPEGQECDPGGDGAHGGRRAVSDFAAALEAMAYQRIDDAGTDQPSSSSLLQRGHFRVCVGGSSVEVGPASDEFSVRVELSAEVAVEAITVIEEDDEDGEVDSEEYSCEGGASVQKEEEGGEGEDDLMASFAAPYSSSKESAKKKKRKSVPTMTKDPEKGHGGEEPIHRRRYRYSVLSSYMIYPARHHMLDESEKEVCCPHPPLSTLAS